MQPSEGSNPEPSMYHPDALSTELFGLHWHGLILIIEIRPESMSNSGRLIVILFHTSVPDHQVPQSEKNGHLSQGLNLGPSVSLSKALLTDLLCRHCYLSVTLKI